MPPPLLPFYAPIPLMCNLQVLILEVDRATISDLHIYVTYVCTYISDVRFTKKSVTYNYSFYRYKITLMI